MVGSPGVMVRLVGWRRPGPSWTRARARRVAAMHRERVGRARSVRRSGDRAANSGGCILGSSGIRAPSSDPRVPLVLTLRVERLGVTAEVVLAAIFAGAAAPVMANADACVVSSQRGCARERVRGEVAPRRRAISTSNQLHSWRLQIRRGPDFFWSAPGDSLGLRTRERRMTNSANSIIANFQGTAFAVRGFA